jgi:hypothetical protein
MQLLETAAIIHICLAWRTSFLFLEKTFVDTPGNVGEKK